MAIRTGPFLVATFALAACGDASMTNMTGGVPAAADPAEAACVRAVSVNAGGATATVAGSEPTGSGSLVMLRSRDGTTWRCVTSGSGVVAELSAV